MASCVADTSWLAALLDADDEFHGTAKAEATEMERIHVPSVILGEFLSLVKYRAGKIAATREAANYLASKANVVLSSPDHDHASTMRYWDAYPKLSYHDACAVASAKRLGVGLVSFDEDQKSAMGAKP